MSTSSLPAFHPIAPQRAFEQVCEQIRVRLQTGELKPGDKLPPERELAGLLGVGRNALREALRALEIAGLVTMKKGGGGGSFIAAGASSVVKRGLQDMVHLGEISLQDLTEARIIIMVDAIRLACERGTETDFDAMDANIELTEGFTILENRELRLSATTEFYRLLAQATKNQTMVLMIDAMTVILIKLIRSDVARPPDALIDARRRFMKQLRARNTVKASQEMTTYLSGLHQHLLASLAATRSAR